ncbi:phage protein [Escherichia coli]|uniref:hypothetical protein n=1 Tax=Escherichia coli TaxID=562 RepID=UPI000DA5177C|nr:hypothetical protein [Escherichia coli]EHY3283201.1 hypothetical protein [Escherichia coli]SQY32751.1 phage protein [Escherichia coli]SQZ01352.1 phage protein [Escherichia coli]HCP2126634.1 hypothetical protein [Escherichia coli]
MESNIKGLVAAGHEMASELKAECGAVDMRSVAKLISDLATQLEVQLVRANALAEDQQKAIESIKQADAAVKLAHEKFSALAAENAELKAGHSYFSYGSEHNFEWHKTAEEAIESAEAAIDDYRGDACDGWSEEVDSICWGIIMQSSTKVGERPRNEDDCCDPAIDTICDYALLPNIETPATDTFLAEVRAQGVDAAIEAAKNLVAQEYEYKDFKAAQSDCCMHPGSDLVGKVEMTEWLVDFAAQLRKGGNQ